ncbi:uncharacterized protein LOC126264825 isoform X2 [Aethina tumida]|nr:uncharacterized protein LOC126264825 isoform X2 [Aethina tumida]
MCKNQKTDDMPMQFYDTQVSHDKSKDTTISMKVNVTRVITNLSIVFNFCKCDFSGNPDSCEYVLSDYANDEICYYIGKENEAWSIFIDHFDKKPLCPIKPGIYVLTNLPITTDFMKYLPISDAVWKLKLEGSDMGQPVSCVELEMQISTFLGKVKRKRH